MRLFGKGRKAKSKEPEVHIPGAGEVTRLSDTCWIEGAEPSAPDKPFPRGTHGMPRLVRSGNGLPGRAVGASDLAVRNGETVGLTCCYLFTTDANKRECRETVEIANDMLAEASHRIRKQLKDLTQLRSLGKIRDLAYLPDANGFDFTRAEYVSNPGRGNLMRLSFVSQDDDGLKGSFTGHIDFDEEGYVEAVDVTSKTTGGDYRVEATRLPEDGLAVRRVTRTAGAGFRGIMYASDAQGEPQDAPAGQVQKEAPRDASADESEKR
jgi:hypothetical protein